MRIPSTALLLPLALSSACDGKEGTVDTGEIEDTEPEYNFEEGCILVDGEGGYRWVTDALVVADPGSTITLCAGEHEESIEVDKAVIIEGPEDEDLVWIGETNMAVITIQGADGVQVRNLTLHSSRNGINIDNATNTVVENVYFTEIQGTGLRAVDAEATSVTDCFFGDLSAPPVGDTGGDTGWDTDTPAADTATDPDDTDTRRETGETGWDTGGPDRPSDEWIGYGGAEFSGGSATISTTTFSQIIGFGVHFTDGAAGTLNGNTISWITYGEVTEEGGVNDGFGIWAEKGAVLTTSGNTLFNDFIAIVIDEADGTLVADTIVAGGYGVYALRGAFSFTDLILEQVYSIGILAVATGDTIVMDGITATGTPEFVHPGDAADGNSMGIQVQADDVEISNTTIDGYNATGLFLTPYNNAINGTLNNVTVNSAGRMGIYGAQGAFALTDVSVTRLRLVDDPETVNVGGSISTGFASSFWYSTVTWDGGFVQDNEFIGLLNAFSTTELGTNTAGEGVEFSGNLYHSVWNYEGTLTAYGAEFTNSAGYYSLSNSLGYTGAVVATNGTTVLDTCSFHDNLATRYYEYVSNGVVYGTESKYASQDVEMNGGSMEITGCDFENGSNGIDVYDAEVEISGSTWNNYNEAAIQVWSNTDNPLKIEDVHMADVGGNAINCYYGAIELENVTISNVNGILSDSTTYVDGVFASQSEYTNYQPAVYTNDCSLFVNGLTVDNSADQALRAYNGDVELYDVTVTGGGANDNYIDGAVEVEFTASGTPSLYVSGLTVQNHLNAPGLRVNSSSNSQGTIEVSDVSVNGSETYGVVVGPLPNTAADLSGITVTNNDGDGLYISNATVNLGVEDTADPANNVDGVSATFNGGHGLYMANSTVTAIGSTLENNVGAGAVVNSGTATLRYGNVEANGFGGTDSDAGLHVLQGGTLTGFTLDSTGNAGSGVQLEATCEATLDACTADDNQAHGIELDASTLTFSNGSLDGNLLSGISMVGSVIDLSNSSLDDNTEYGMVCDTDSSFTQCDTNTFDNNTLGDTSGCDAVTCTP